MRSKMCCHRWNNNTSTATAKLSHCYSPPLPVFRSFSLDSLGCGAERTRYFSIFPVELIHVCTISFANVKGSLSWVVCVLDFQGWKWFRSNSANSEGLGCTWCKWRCVCESCCIVLWFRWGNQIGDRVSLLDRICNRSGNAWKCLYVFILRDDNLDFHHTVLAICWELEFFESFMKFPKMWVEVFIRNSKTMENFCEAFAHVKFKTRTKGGGERGGGSGVSLCDKVIFSCLQSVTSLRGRGWGIYPLCFNYNFRSSHHRAAKNSLQ